MERRAALKVLWVVFGVTVVGLGGIAAIVAAAPSRGTTPSGRQIALLAMSSSAPGSARYEAAKAALDSMDASDAARVYSSVAASLAAEHKAKTDSSDSVFVAGGGHFFVKSALVFVSSEAHDRATSLYASGIRDPDQLMRGVACYPSKGDRVAYVDRHLFSTSRVLVASGAFLGCEGYTDDESIGVGGLKDR